MAFIKKGDVQPIINIFEDDLELTEEELQEKLEAIRQAAKNIDEDGNKIELHKKSGK